MFLNFTKFGWLSTPVRSVDGFIARAHGAPPVQGLLPSWLMRLAGTLLFVLLSLFSSQASAASACPSPRNISVVAGQEYYEDYSNSACSPFGLTGTLVPPQHGTLEDSNQTNAVRYRNTNLSATSDTFTVKDDVAQPIVYNVTITSAIVLSPATVPTATVAQAYPVTALSATGGAAPYTYAVTAGSLPAGMSLSGAGSLSGTPTAGGTFNFTVRATDSLAANGTRAYALTVNAPTITVAPTVMPAMTVGLAYSQGITAANGTATYTYAITGGSLPTGLSLAANGTLSGTPTAAGPYNFTVTATDSSSGSGPYTGSRAYSVTVAAGAPVAGAVSATVAYGSSANPITLNLSGGAATSVAVASAASHGTATASGTSITYTPTAGYGGPDSFTYTASNGVGTSAPATVTITVGGPTITIAPSTVPAAAVGSAYSQSVTAANGGAPYTYAISAGALPAGLTLNASTGVLSGTPTAGGVFNFTVRATDSSTGSGPYSGARAYSMTVAAPTISITPTVMPAMTAGVAYSQSISAAGGTATYSYAITGGSLPTGLSLAPDGTLSGTPTAAGPYNFTVTATDSSTGSGPYTGSRAYSVTVAAGAPVAGNVSTSVAYGSSANPITLNLSGGAATSVAVASAASHGTATASGTSITYTPTAGYGGPDSFTYTASNGVGTSAPATVTITVGGPTITIAPSTVPAAAVGSAYSQSVTAANGGAPYTYAISAGALPAGLTLNASTGVLSGTPTAGGVFNFTVRATDSSTGSGPYSGARAYSMTVAAPTISITPTVMPAMTAGVAYSQSISAAGGTATYSYAITGGSLPTGLSLAPDGTLSGTPTAAGPFNFTVTGTDSSTGSGPYTGSRAYSVTVAAGAPVAGAVSASLAYGSSANPITLNLSGGAATSVAVASAASHGMATASGTSITYTPTAGYGGPDSFTYTATNGIGTSAPATVTITVGGPTITIAPSTVPAAAVGSAYSQSVTAANGTGPYTYAISAGTLPAGLTLNAATGVLSGTPTAGGVFNFTVRATDSSTGSGPYSGARAYSMTVTAPTITVAPTVMPAMTAGVAYSQGIAAGGGTAPYSYAITGGSVPTGLSLAADGTLSGTPTAAGPYNFTVTATDSSSGSGPYTGSRAYSVTVVVAPPVAGAVSATVAYGSSANPITLNLSGGAATSVAVASAAGHGTATVSGTSITYTPAAGYSGPDSFSYTASNGGGTSAEAIVTITVTPSVPVAGAVSATVAYGSSANPITLNLSGGAATSVAVASAAGHGTATVSGTSITYTPAAGYSGPDSFSYTASNGGGTSAAAVVTITVTPSVPIAGAVSATVAYGSSANPITLNLSGGTATSVAVASAAGHGTATVSGTSITYTPTAGYAGPDSFTYTASNAGGTSASATVTVTVGNPSVSLTPATLPNPTAEAAYTATLAATGGTAPYTYSVTSGTLPVGLSLNAATGVLSGTTNVAGSFPVSIKVADSSTGAGAPFSASNSYTLIVVAPVISVTPGSLAAPKVATAYSQQLSASGGVAPYAYTVSAGSLPAGLTLSSSGLLSGTPTAGGNFTATVQAADAHQFTGTQSYTLVVSSATVSLTPTTLPNPTAEAVYTTTLTAAGGTAPYTFSVSSGTLPAGLSLNAATGVLSGTTNVAGSFPFSIKVTDSSTGTGAPFSATSSYTVTVGAPTITLTPATLPAATVATAYSQPLSASGGIAPYAYTVSGGSLPAGLALSSSGLLSGTPTAAGSFTVTVQAADAHLFTGTQSYTLVVSSATVSLTPATLSNPTAEAAYSATLSATGGTAPYTFSVSSGTLPAGLSLNGATGVLSGTTNVAGSFPFSIKVTDSSTGVGAPFSASNSYTLAVAAPVLTLTPASLAPIRAGDAYSQTFTAAGGIAPYAYSVSGGALPTGLVLNAATGIVSGTPTVAGSYNFTLQAKDAHQFTVQQALTLQVNQAPPPVPNETATTSANQEVSLTIASTDGSPITDVTIVTPPQHGRVTVVTSGAAGGGSGRSFKVTYVPNANYFGPDAFSYTATGPGGTSAPATVSVTVAPQPVPVPVAKTVTVLAGTPVTLPVTQGATGGPFTAVAITTQPASGTAAVNGMDIVYTPGINTSGQISIGYTVSNVFGTSAPVTSTISVNPMPQVASQSATVVAGLTVNVDLTAGATGGPFTAANVLSVAPAEAGKAVVRDVGTAGKPSYQLSFAASGKFAGAAVVSYTLSNAFATSKPGVVNVTVTARRDPSVDPEVIGLQAAQADAARRFASAQLSNFTQRLESLHGDGWGRSSFGLSLTPPNDSGNPTAALARWQEQEADRVFGTAVKPFMRKASLRQPDAGFSSERQQVDVSGATNGLPDMPQRPDTQKQALALWLGGAVDFGQHDVNGRDTGFRFRTNGVSVGGDYRLSDLATLGVGAGFSHDRSDVGQNGSRSTADSAVAAVYGSLRPSKGVFLDGVLGYGTLQYDASRYLTDGSGFATGERDGKQVFGALVGGIEMRQEMWMWSPYGRVELMSAKLDPYTEKAAGINALSYFKQTVRSRIGALGVRAEGIYVGGLGTWFPRARLEYRHQFQGADDARLAYADLAADGPVYVIRTVPQQTGNWTAGLGVKLLLSNGMTITLDYNSNLNMDSGRSQSVMFGIAMPLK
ncbi:putative Ig domain-containing protein [Janthinobacterium lividum]|nr:putative Ig domain-containing protein [Janthinobacterium lividum]WQE27684.1 putative Ig domain-containing protein [Janthinobacterium lividum]STQ98598.1 Uncharacterized protein with a C-terminal OMP (outer membrane protein) domain [Janthinobacterium lividum]